MNDMENLTVTSTFEIHTAHPCVYVLPVLTACATLSHPRTEREQAADLEKSYVQ